MKRRIHKRTQSFDTRMIIDLLRKEHIHFEWNNVLRRFRTFSSLEHQKEQSITWVRDQLPNDIAMTCTHLIANVNFETRCDNIALIKVEDPRYVFARILQTFFSKPFHQGHISQHASIHASAKIGKGGFIGDFVTIGEKCVIGRNVRIDANVTLYDNVHIGDNVTIHSGTVIGAEGYGYVRNEEKSFEKMPQLGGVVVERNVEIGANTCIDRGTIDNTFIGEGTKIDNLCHIAHNVTIGRNCMVVAHSEISGSVVLGDNVWTAPCVTIKDGIKIGENAFIGLKSLILEDIPPNTLVYGHPGKIAGRR